MKNAIRTAFLICASLIGAGFASGREVMEFFSPCGFYGLIPATLSVFLICVAVYIMLKVPEEITKMPVYRWLTFMFLICVLSVMIAGSSELMPYGRQIMTVCVLVTTYYGIRGVENLGLILTPAMVLFIVLFGAMRLKGINFPIDAMQTASPFLYAGYNVLSYPILLEHTDRSRPVLTSCIVGVVMLPLMVIIYLVSSGFAQCEMPFVMAVGKDFFCTAMLFSAIYTTAACSAFCACDIVGGKRLSSTCVIIAALLISYTGFGKLISDGYRLFGFAGVLVCGYLMLKLLNPVKKRVYLRNIKDNE